jgi:hypothetical protein
MGGKVKPGQGGKHKHTGSGDLHAGEPPSPLSASAADHSWTPGGFSQPEMTDTYSLSQLSPATIATGTPSGRSKGNSFFKNLSFGSKRRHSRGAASPGVPSSPTLPGATPTHEGSMSFSASASSTSGAAGSQSPADSLCHAGAGAARHASSKLNHHNSSGDADDAEFGSCYSDTMQSPSYAHNEGMFDDTLVLQQVSARAASLEQDKESCLPPHSFIMFYGWNAANVHAGSVQKPPVCPTHQWLTTTMPAPAVCHKALCQQLLCFCCCRCLLFLLRSTGAMACQPT